MSDPFVGEIKCVGFTYAPVGWEFCNGQTMAIAQNQALFSLLGTRFGGDGKTTFQLPNLNVNAPGNTNTNTIRICGGATTITGQPIVSNIPTNYTIPANVVRVVLDNP